MLRKLLKHQEFPASEGGNAEANAYMIEELEAAIANLKSGKTTALAMVQIQPAEGHNLIDLLVSAQEHDSMLVGLNDIWQRVAQKRQEAIAEAIAGLTGLVQWVPEDQEQDEDEGEPKGTLQ